VTLDFKVSISHGLRVRRGSGNLRVLRAAAGALLACTAAGCGASAAPPASAPPPPALAAHAVPYLESHARTVPAATVAREAAQPGLASQMRAWGYVNGTARSFHGESRRRLQVVESRTLQFRSPGGSQAFIAFVRAHAPSFLPGAAQPGPFASRGRQGLVVRAQPCACHLSTPALLAVVGRGPRVTWLEINGPGATTAVLRRLTARAP
jgi:hypothetical protein